MNRLDPRLRQLVHPDSSARSTMMKRLGLSREYTDSDLRPIVNVLIRCRHPGVVAELRDAGSEIRAVIEGVYTIVSATVPIESLTRISEIEGVLRVEASLPMFPELDVSRHETRVDQVHALKPSIRGKRALIGIIDAAIDYTHPDFRNPDGTSRILYLWDQAASPHPSISQNLCCGREYTKREIDSALKTNTKIHSDIFAHGTHVSGIAAGNGAGDPLYTGIAPEAGLIFVALELEPGTTIGRSNNAVEAFDYVVRRADQLARPVAINLSQGMNRGGHSGESVVESAIDGLARRPGVAIIKSAGNEQEWRTHAGGQIATGQTVVLDIVVSNNQIDSDLLEVWCDGADEISVALQPPGSARLDFVTPGTLTQSFETGASNQVDVTSELDADGTGDTATAIIISHGNVYFVQPGTWKLWLRGDRINNGRYDVWIETTGRRFSGGETRFAPSSADDSRTITIPGTSSRVITVGAYVSRSTPGFSSQVGHTSAFSSRGPTRFGLRKPDISAPGDIVVSARSSQSSATPNPSAFYTPMPGTSVAAPHVAGAAALILSLRPSFNSDQVRQILTSTARRDGFAATAPDDEWGNGKLDIEAAIARAQTAQFPDINNVVVSGGILTWETDIPTTGAVRFHTHPEQLLLGKSLGSRTDLRLKMDHIVSLEGLEPGTYYCEVLAYTSDELLTVDDQHGTFHVVQV